MESAKWARYILGSDNVTLAVLRAPPTSAVSEPSEPKGPLFIRLSRSYSRAGRAGRARRHSAQSSPRLLELGQRLSRAARRAPATSNPARAARARRALAARRRLRSRARGRPRATRQLGVVTGRRPRSASGRPLPCGLARTARVSVRGSATLGPGLTGGPRSSSARRSCSLCRPRRGRASASPCSARRSAAARNLLAEALSGYSSSAARGGDVRRARTRARLGRALGSWRLLRFRVQLADGGPYRLGSRVRSARERFSSRARRAGAIPPHRRASRAATATRVIIALSVRVTSVAGRRRPPGFRGRWPAW
jgi:hypothetical protein